MAERRMFAKTIVLSDEFLDMPLSARCLYFTLSMFADDDGFVNNPKSIMRQCNASTDDFNILALKKFIIAFDDGVIVIKHWRINNYLRGDRHTCTKYTEHLSELSIDSNGSYTKSGIPSANQVPTIGIPSIGKDSIDKNSKDKDISPKPSKHEHGEYKNVLLTDDEYAKLLKDYVNAEECIKYLDEYIEMKGYKAKSHNLAIRKWVVDAVKKSKAKPYTTKNIVPMPEYMNNMPESIKKATEEEIAEARRLQEEMKKKRENK